ncbi:retrotransposon protein, putative, ty1-copia subclass [Tanacetum coccineum]
MDGKVHTFKARLVATGCTQTYGVDYGETFSLVADIRAMRILLAIVAFYYSEIWQMDVKTAFLNDHLSEDVYMMQPEGFVDPKHPNKVCKLQRSIYGLKQTSRSWNKRFDVEIKKIGFTQNLDEPCVYLKASRSNVAFLILYVDDILVMGNNVTMLQEVKAWLHLRTNVMAAPTIPVSADSFEGSFGDTIDIGVDVIHPVPVALVVFPAATLVMTLAQHEEVIRGIQEHLLEVPIQEELRVDVAGAKSTSLRATIRTMRAVETVLRNRMRDEDKFVLRLSISWLRFRSPTFRTERTSRNSRSS